MKTEKFTGLDKVLLVFGWGTSVHCEDWWICKSYSKILWPLSQDILPKWQGIFVFIYFFKGQGGGGAEGVEHKAKLNMFSMVLSKMPKV
jgi:hypothetical protein